MTCDDVSGNVRAGGSITCDLIEGDAEACGNITCAEICGSVTAGGDVYCDEINVEPPSDSSRRTGGSKSLHIRKTEENVDNTHTITYTFSRD